MCLYLINMTLLDFAHQFFNLGFNELTPRINFVLYKNIAELRDIRG